MRPAHDGAKEIVRILKDEYEIRACPNGGVIADVVYRIGHIAAEDNHKLIDALHDMNRGGLL